MISSWKGPKQLGEESVAKITIELNDVNANIKTKQHLTQINLMQLNLCSQTPMKNNT